MKVALVGAGLSALVAARALRHCGAQVTLFDKARAVGGRLSTRHLEWADLDLGAQYFTARGPHFRKTVEDWIVQQCACRWEFTPFSCSSGDLQPSPDDTPRFCGLPAMNSISHWLARDLDIRLGTRIAALERFSRGWTLHGGSGDSFAGFDWVLLSAPVEQVRPLLQGISPLAGVLPKELHTPCWAVGLATVGTVLPEIQGIFGDEVISWVSRQSSKPGRSPPPGADDTWMLHFGPAWSRENGRDTTADIAGISHRWLESRLRVQLSILHEHRHYWRYANLPAQDRSATFLVDADRQLAVIGAWCAGGKVEGAYQSGADCAQMLAACQGA